MQTPMDIDSEGVLRLPAVYCWHGAADLSVCREAYLQRKRSGLKQFGGVAALLLLPDLEDGSVSPNIPSPRLWTCPPSKGGRRPRGRGDSANIPPSDRWASGGRVDSSGVAVFSGKATRR